MRTGKKQFAIIAFARYYNLLVEYLILLATAVIMSPGERGQYVMYISVISFFALIASLSYEQYGAVIANKYRKEFDDKNFFSVLCAYSIIIGACAGIFSAFWLKAPVIDSFLLCLNVVSLNLGKQAIVFFQNSNNVSYFFKRYILYKSIYFALVAIAVAKSESIEMILFCILFSNIVFLMTIGLFDGDRISKEINISKFWKNFLGVKYIYLTSVITACYSFVDLYIIYTNLDAQILSAYNLAIQLNMAVAVIGQVYNVHIYSNRHGKDLKIIFSIMSKVNVFIILISATCALIVYSDFFLNGINFVFGNEYPQLYEITRYTILILPASLISMFYAPIWISTERYFILMFANLSSLLIFTCSALLLISDGIFGVVYAQYLTACYTVFVNVSYYIYAKSCYQKTYIAVE